MSLDGWNLPVIRQDRRALRALTQQHWRDGKWRVQPEAHPDEVHAKRSGYIYDPLPLHHDEAVTRAIAVAAELRPVDVAAGFVASLSTRRLELRSALGSYALAARLVPHEFSGRFGCNVCCAMEGACEHDFSQQNFERYRWGGVRHLDPAYMWFDLHLFRRTEKPDATTRDAEMFQQILTILRDAPPDSRPGDIAKALAGVFPSNQWERRILLQLLAYAGVLEPADRPSFSETWVDCIQREVPAQSKNDWSYPLVWWRGRDGINLAALRRFFPDFAPTAE